MNREDNSESRGRRVANKAQSSSTAPAPFSPLLTPRDVAELVRVDPSTVYRWIKAGRLQSVRLGDRTVRIRPEDLESFLTC